MSKVFILLNGLLVTKFFGQTTTDDVTYRNKIDLKNSNNWVVTLGLCNFILLLRKFTIHKKPNQIQITY